MRMRRRRLWRCARPRSCVAIEHACVHCSRGSQDALRAEMEKAGLVVKAHVLRSKDADAGTSVGMLVSRTEHLGRALAAVRTPLGVCARRELAIAEDCSVLRWAWEEGCVMQCFGVFARSLICLAACAPRCLRSWAGAKEAGVRCRRKTSNLTGFCWQHGHVSVARVDRELLGAVRGARIHHGALTGACGAQGWRLVRNQASAAAAGGCASF